MYFYLYDISSRACALITFFCFMLPEREKLRDEMIYNNLGDPNVQKNLQFYHVYSFFYYGLFSDLRPHSLLFWGFKFKS